MSSVPNSKDISLTTGLGPSCSENYSYIPLPTATSIRVIEWQKDIAPTADLRCNLRIIDLENPKRSPYCCISYTWGAADGIDAEDAESLASLFTNTIVCDDQLLRVTENAYSALAELRWRGRACLYWMDAVSINQQDVEERSQQVALMGRIYAESDRTIVWLGESDDTTSTLYHQSMVAPLMIPNHSQRMYQPMNAMSLTEFLALLPQSRQQADVKGIQAFFARNWFQRLWVVQEVVLARNLMVLCGEFIFNWQELAEFTDEYTRYIELLGRSDTAERALRGLDTMRLISALRGDSNGFRSLDSTAFGPPTRLNDYCSSLIILIQALVPSSATDVRDRFYAPMALANRICNPDSRLNFTPDYSKTAETTFYDVTVFMLQQMSTPSFISLCKPRDPNHARLLPSWVPDLRRRSAQKPLSSLTACNATAGWDAFSNSVDHNVNGVHLKVHGRECATITNILSSDTNLADIKVLTLLSFASEIQSFHSEQSLPLRKRRSAAHASPEYSLWQTLTSNPYTTSNGELGEYGSKSDELELTAAGEATFALWLKFKVMLDLYHGVLPISDMRRVLKKAIAIRDTIRAEELESTKCLQTGEELSFHDNSCRSIYRKTENGLGFYRETIETLSPQQLTWNGLARLNLSLNVIWKYIPWEDLWLNTSNPNTSPEPAKCPRRPAAAQPQPKRLPMLTDHHAFIDSEYEIFDADQLLARIFLEKLLHFTTDRVMIRADDDRLGLAPRGAQVGDSIWFIRGCRAPFVLRRICEGGKVRMEDSNRDYELLGEAYIAGLMDGAFSKRWSERDLKAIRLM